VSQRHSFTVEKQVLGCAAQFHRITAKIEGLPRCGLRPASTDAGHAWNGVLFLLCGGRGKLPAKARGDFVERYEGVAGWSGGERIDRNGALLRF
jgi:hypothetical protein